MKRIYQISYVHAMELLLTATLIDVTTAAQISLVNRVILPEELMPWTLATAATIAANSPTAVQAVKQQISDGTRPPSFSAPCFRFCIGIPSPAERGLRQWADQCVNAPVTPICGGATPCF